MKPRTRYVWFIAKQNNTSKGGFMHIIYDDRTHWRLQVKCHSIINSDLQCVLVGCCVAIFNVSHQAKHTWNVLLWHPDQSVFRATLSNLLPRCTEHTIRECFTIQSPKTTPKANLSHNGSAAPVALFDRWILNDRTHTVYFERNTHNCFERIGDPQTPEKSINISLSSLCAHTISHKRSIYGCTSRPTRGWRCWWCAVFRTQKGSFAQELAGVLTALVLYEKYTWYVLRCAFPHGVCKCRWLDLKWSGSPAQSINVYTK